VKHKKTAFLTVEGPCSLLQGSSIIRQPKKAVCIRRLTHATKQPEAGSSLSVFPAY